MVPMARATATDDQVGDADEVEECPGNAGSGHTKDFVEGVDISVGLVQQMPHPAGHEPAEPDDHRGMAQREPKAR
jgi:hypothetical protein